MPLVTRFNHCASIKWIKTVEHKVSSVFSHTEISNFTEGVLQYVLKQRLEKSTWPQKIRDQRSLFVPSSSSLFFRWEERNKRSKAILTAIHVGGTAPGTKCQHHSVSVTKLRSQHSKTGGKKSSFVPREPSVLNRHSQSSYSSSIQVQWFA